MTTHHYIATCQLHSTAHSSTRSRASTECWIETEVRSDHGHSAHIFQGHAVIREELVYDRGLEWSGVVGFGVGRRSTAAARDFALESLWSDHVHQLLQMIVYGYVLRTVDTETVARQSWVSLVIPTLETLRHYMVSGLPVVAADVRDFVQPRSVVDVTSNVHLLTPSERDVW